MSNGFLDNIVNQLYGSRSLEAVAQRLDAGQDSNLAVPLTARPLLVAATFAYSPRPMLVCVAGEEAAARFSRDLAAFLGNNNVLHLPQRSDIPWIATIPDPAEIGQRVEALHSLVCGENRVVVSSASALLRCLPSPKETTFQPLLFSVGQECQTKGVVRFLSCSPEKTAGQKANDPFCPVTPNVTSGSGEAETQLAYSDIAPALVSMGYRRDNQADEPGSFSLRGDVLDIFATTAAHPVRIELFGDQVETIRRILPATGQTIGSEQSVRIFPAREFFLAQDNVDRLRRSVNAAESLKLLPPNVSYHLELLEQGTAFVGAERYLPYLHEQVVSALEWMHRRTLVILAEPRSLFDDAANYYDTLVESAGKQKTSLNGLYTAPGQLDFGAGQRLTLLSLLSSGTKLDGRLEVKHVDTAGSAERLTAAVRSMLMAGNLTFVAQANHRVQNDLMLAFSDASIPFDSDRGSTTRADKGDRGTFLLSPSGVEHGDGSCALIGIRAQEPSPCSTPSVPPVPLSQPSVVEPKLSTRVAHFIDINLPQSLIIPAAKLALLTLADNQAAQVVKRAKQGRKRTLKAASDPTAYTFGFKPGDYVVHATHGIALFKQMVRREVDGVERDYLFLEYAKGDKLYSPVELIDKVSRYVGVEGTAPRLTRLNTSDWSRATGKARKAARQLAFDLVDLYSRRANAQGFSYGPDTDEQYQMEMQFEYSETPDQLAAIADVKADMESPRPMDRLICGDVGFGKTEVALRAAFKAVQAGKQVILLCPTTILAQQHFTTFSERFEPFALRVDVLSRFRTSAQQSRTLEAVAAGKVDVLVGTHRLLSPDVNPQNLGLVIIDEEQRFGVQHKEQLKNLRDQLDILSLSATPIPRTLQMALSGVRDMSLINTPPLARSPIRVHVGEWDESVVSAAIRHELARGGQVYYVSNRVKNIDDAVQRVSAAAPEARIEIAHGQMSEHQLEAAMERFSANQVDVLVATTIIESGLDNPHSNTLIIEDSQRLGLAQLYQLKGRVGRSHAQAYAYFLFPSERRLTPEAIDRLTAISEYQELGSGMRVAMRDLEIRGAGSLLGAEQHGNLSAVGFDLFASMLSEAVEAARLGDDEDGETDADVRVDLPVHAYLPEELIAATDERVLYYRKIAGAATVEDLEKLAIQMGEKFGGLPAPAINLIDRAKARLLLAELGASSAFVTRGKLNINGLELTPEQIASIKQRGGTYMVKSLKLLFPVTQGAAPLGALIELLESLLVEGGMLEV